MNVVTIIGRLTDHPELKHTSSDIAVCSFCLAVTRPKAKDKTDFINCTAWRNTAEFICKYFRKGQMMAVHGSIQTRTYTDSNGAKRKTFEIVADDVNFADSKKDDSGSYGGAYTGTDSGHYRDTSPSNVAPPAPVENHFEDDSGFENVEFSDDDDLPF